MNLFTSKDIWKALTQSGLFFCSSFSFHELGLPQRCRRVEPVCKIGASGLSKFESCQSHKVFHGWFFMQILPLRVGETVPSVFGRAGNGRPLVSHTARSLMG